MSVKYKVYGTTETQNRINVPRFHQKMKNPFAFVWLMTFMCAVLTCPKTTN